MPVSDAADLEITVFEWVPPFAQGYVRCLRPRWACEELGLAYRERAISAMQRPDWYFDEQPWGQVPHLRDGEVAMFESGAMLVHLAETGGGLLAASGQARADALSWLVAGLNSIEPGLFEMTRVAVFAKDEDWAKLRRPSLEQQLGERFDRLSAAVGKATSGGSWLAGDFSIADIMLATILREADTHDLVAGRAPLADHLSRATARPAFAAALEAQLARFRHNEPTAGSTAEPAPAGA